MKIVRIQQTTHQQKSRTKYGNAKCTMWKNLKRAWWCSINYQLTFTILFFSIGANIKSIKLLFFSSTMKVIGNINLFAKKKIKAFGWTKNTIQWKWLLFIWKRQQKEPFKRNAKPEQLNTKTISKQSKMFNEIKEKHLLNKPSIEFFLHFLLEFHTLNTNWVFRYLLEWMQKKNDRVYVRLHLCKIESYRKSVSKETAEKREKKEYSRALFYFSRCCKSSSALKLHHTI